MSRDIAPKTSVIITAKESVLWQTDSTKLLFTIYQGRRCALTIQNDRLVAASFFPKVPSEVGAIYIGKVKNVAKNLDACFVEIAEGKICFLSFKNASAPYLVNRKFDGRILEGDELLVQVVRDAQKTKRASVTAEISLANSYFAIISGSTKVNYSSKLSKESKNAIKKAFTENTIIKNGELTQEYSDLLPITEYERLKSAGILLDSLPVLPVGVVARTKAGELESSQKLLEMFYNLSVEFIKLLYYAMHRNCFSCLKKAPMEFEPILQQFILDIENAKETGEIITDQETLYTQLNECYHALKINSQVKVRLYQDNMLPLSMLYSLNKKIESALENRVWLKSGGYLVIEPTEALTVIDVNSGKYEAGKGSKEAYRKINLEAAQEVAVQIRLRNLSGIIVVDFINMDSEMDKRELLSYLKSLVKQDKIQTTVVDMTPLGLVEITRKKINKPLREQFSQSMDESL